METAAMGRVVTEATIENVDFVVDPRSQKLTGNPAHGGEHMFELF